MTPDRLTKVDETTWRIEPSGPMRVPAIIYADETLIRDMDDKVGEQAANHGPEVRLMGVNGY